MNRDRVLRAFREEIAAKRPLIGAGAGAGLSAKCSAKGGADLLIVYNSGRFRMAGQPSLTGLLPVGDANQIVLEMGAEILSLRLPVPVFAGVFSSDPFRRMELFLPQIRALGYEGIQNFPSIGLFEGTIRENFEEVGLGFEREVEMVALAARFDLVSAPYVFNADEARRMARAGADIVVAHIGTTTSGMVGAHTSLSLDQSLEVIEAISSAARAENSSVIVLCHGGPLRLVRIFSSSRTGAPRSMASLAPPAWSACRLSLPSSPILHDLKPQYVRRPRLRRKRERERSLVAAGPCGRFETDPRHRRLQSSFYEDCLVQEEMTERGRGMPPSLPGLRRPRPRSELRCQF